MDLKDQVSGSCNPTRNFWLYIIEKSRCIPEWKSPQVCDQYFYYFFPPYECLWKLGKIINIFEIG